MRFSAVALVLIACFSLAISGCALSSKSGEVDAAPSECSAAKAECSAAKTECSAAKTECSSAKKKSCCPSAAAPE